MMPQLVIPDLDEIILNRLRERAAMTGRSLEAEARTILADAVASHPVRDWARVNALRDQLAASGRTFPDSTDQLREDRNR